MTGAVFLGGSFDPPHLGHLAMADAAAAALGVPAVIFVPAGQQPLKETRTPAAHRLRMLEALLAGTSHRVGAWELERPGPSYTVDTLRQIRPLFEGRLVWLVGADALRDLHRWKDLPGILELADLVPLTRPGHALVLPEEVLRLAPKASSILSRAITMPAHPASSTKIRSQFATGERPTGLTPAVEAVIRELGLYSPALQ